MDPQNPTARTERGRNDRVASRRRRRIGPFLLLLLVLFGIVWASYWYVAYRFAETFVAEAPASAISQSVALSCAERRFGGFPLQLTIDCDRAIAASGDKAHASLAHVTATAPLYNPGWVEAEITGPFEFNGVNNNVRSDWRDGRLELMAGFGGVRELQASFADLKLTVGDLVGDTIWSAGAAYWATEIRSADGDEDALLMVLSAEDLVIELAGGAYPQLSGTATLTLRGSGNRLDREPSDLIGRWLSNGGEFNIDHMALTSGDVIAEVDGPMILEVDGTLSGDLDVRYAGEADLPLLVAAIFPWLAGDAEVIADAIRAMSQPIELHGQPAHRVRINIRHGTLNIGLIPILTIPSIGPLDHFL